MSFSPTGGAVAAPRGLVPRIETPRPVAGETPYRPLSVPRGTTPVATGLADPRLATAGTNQPPTVPVISPSGTFTVYTNQRMYFNATASDPEFTDTLNWTWSWGDGTHTWVNRTTSTATVMASHAWAATGTFQVSVTVSDGVNGDLPAANPVTVNVVPVAAGHGWVKGTVTDASSAYPLAGAMVTASPGGYIAYTAANGTYSLTLPPGVYVVNASYDLYAQGMAQGVAVTPGNATLIYFALGYYGGQIYGSVTDAATGSAIGGALIVARALDDTEVAGATNGQGAFNLNVKAGIYSVSASAAGHTTYTNAWIPVAAGSYAFVAFPMWTGSPAPEIYLSETVGRPGQGLLIQWSINTTVGGRWTFQYGDGETIGAILIPGTTSLLTSHFYPGEGNYTTNLTETSSDTRTAISSAVVDGTPPTTVANISGTLGGGGWYRSPVWVTLNASDALSGVVETLYRVDGDMWITYMSPFPLWDTGNHTIEYQSFDKAWNPEAIQTQAIKLDDSPPVITVHSPAAGAVVTSSTVTVSWTAAEAGSGIASVEVSVDGGAFFIPNGSSIVLRGLSDGQHTVLVQMTDVAGNLANTLSWFIVQPGILFGLGALEVGGIVAAVLAMAVVSVVLWRTHRRNQPRSPEEAVPPERPPQA